MAAPIINPPLPLLTPIPGGFLHGKIIRIHGSVNPAAQRFAVNLQCGASLNPRDDLALHLNPRFPEHVVIRNSLLNGQWGQEDRHGPTFPFQPGQGFEILLLSDSGHYKIAINGQHFTEFHFRAAPERVSYLSVDGDIMISTITFEGGNHAGAPPGMAMPGQPMAPPMPMPGHGMPSHGMPSHGMPTPGYGGGHSHPQPYPTNPSVPYPTQPGGVPYPVQPGMPHYPTQPGMSPYPNPGQYPPGSQPYEPYPTAPSSSSGKGLSGLLGKASTAVAGALGATGVGGLLGLAAGRAGGGYAAPYPGQPGQSHVGGGGGGLLGSLGTAMGAAALGSALLNPKKAAKQQRKAQKKALKYGLPLAGVGVGAYALHKGMKHGHHGFHHGSSSSSSSSEEE